MFQKLVREHPTLQEHWHSLLEIELCLETHKSLLIGLTLVRKYVAADRVLTPQGC
ncbi:lysozyme murein hydrolase [Salmonella phage 19]|nr:lysozyme murein hydrolase [Salmonella phage 19]